MENAPDEKTGEKPDQMEHLMTSVAQICEQLLEFRDFRKVLDRIERSIDLMRNSDLSSASRSADVARPRQSSGASFGCGSRLLEPSDSALANGNSGTPSMFKMIDVLEEHTARALQQQRRRMPSVRQDPEFHQAAPKRQPEVPAADIVGLHQPPVSPDSSPSKGSQARAVSHDASASMSCVSVISPVQPAPKPNVVIHGAESDVVRLCRRKSLDELQADHNAVITATGGAGLADSLKVAATSPRHNSCESSSTLPCIGWFLLSFSGILDFYAGNVWRALARCILVAQMIMICGSGFVVSSWQGTIPEIEPLISTVLYLMGAMLAAISLRRSKITSLLGPTEYVLDDYATECDFVGEWRRASWLRLCQILGVITLMLASRAAALLWTTQLSYGKLTLHLEQDVATAVTFTPMAVHYCTACYCILHITAGLELAVDSFAVRCFNTCDMEAAVAEWNLVQATLRQTSCKLSEFLVVMASSCIISLILFAYQVFSLNLSKSEHTALDVVLWLGWLYPPALLFLYSLSSAAAVTEKVDRLAPLVNSWSFDTQDVLDESRQYIVQYILQSRAGFYTRGIRLSSSNVQKLCYYFAAGSFGLLANFWQ